MMQVDTLKATVETLAQARTVLGPLPPEGSTHAALVAYYQRAAATFTAVAKVDTNHKWEASAEAWIAKDRLNQLGAGPSAYPAYPAYPA
jgi:hypothetical protein